MNIAFCINRLGLVGLGGTLSSLTRNCSDKDKLKLWFVCAGLTNKEKEQIKKLLKACGFQGSLKFIDFNPFDHFGAFASLHDDWTTYGRLLLADFMHEDQVLYLDSDLVVEVDVLGLIEFNFEGHILAAVGGGKFRYTLGNKFYANRVGISLDTEYFNAGVLLLNLNEWRKRKVKEQCLRIAKQYPKELPSHDQSLLNIFCAGSFAKLPFSYNCEWEATHAKPNVADKMILHFIGSPKPWDPMGFILHNGYSKWLEYADIEWDAYFRQVTFAELKRIWHIRRSYLRCILHKMNG